MAHTLIFDIGKTNKKAFIFNEAKALVYKVYENFKELEDEDLFPCDDLVAIQEWILRTLRQVFQDGSFDIKAINFSTYGASFVHIDKKGVPLTPLYNYLKPIPEHILNSFYDKYGPWSKISRETASPALAMLNSGLQLYWLKYSQAALFKKIRWSLHFPQYLSYLLTGVPLSEYTSIGCHTMLWDFEQADYHQWVYTEGIDQKLAPIASENASSNILLYEKKVKIGIGIHDSSAALIPYLHKTDKPFLLLSTGTWSIALNPFNEELLSSEELENDCLNFIRIDGKAVKAARLFLGQEYSLQVDQLNQYFQKDTDAHKTISFDLKLYQELRRKQEYHFKFEHLKTPWPQVEKTRLEVFQNLEEAYHHLLWELVQLQILAAERAIGKTKIEKLYIDGGFSNSEVFVAMLAQHFKGIPIQSSAAPLGSALGAALIIED